MYKFKLLVQSIEDELFFCKSDVVEYAVIEEELIQLFNFCLRIQDTIVSKVDQLVGQKKELEINPLEIYGYDQDLDIEVANGEILLGIEEFELGSWTHSLNFIVPMNQILLINIFIEKSLKSLCSEFSPNKKTPYYDDFSIELKQLQYKSKTQTYIHYLNQQCGINFQCPTDLEYLDGEIRKIRNYFVHGNWKQATKTAKDININQLFIVTSNLFTEIENASLSNHTT